MPARSVEDQVSALLARAMVERRSAGVQYSGLESSAVFDSIALSLLLRPRIALYFEHLARNGLAVAVRAELAFLSTLKQDIADCGNPSYKIEHVAALRQARNALLQLEGLPRVGSSPSALAVFEKSVQEFLDKGLAKNVRRKGTLGMSRPAAEALLDLPTTLQALKTQHAVVLERLYAIAVGIENFISAPFAALLGTSIVARARQDVEAMLESVEDPSVSRDYAVRLLASQAAIRTVATPPALFSDLFTAPGSASGVTLSVTLNEDLRDVVQVGDVVLLDSERRVVDVQQSFLELDASAAFSGQVVGKSALVTSHLALAKALDRFLVGWRGSKFAEDLTWLDQSVARLLASQSPAQRTEAANVVAELEDSLTALLNLLVDPSTMLPTGAALGERQSVESILVTLAERHYDRATDLLLKGDLQSLLEFDQDSASYAGNFLKASSAYAKTGTAEVDEEADSAISAGRVG